MAVLIIGGYLVMWPIAAGVLVRFDIAEPEEAVPAGLIWPALPLIALFVGLFMLASGEP